MSNVTKIEELRLARAKAFADMGEVLERQDDKGVLTAEDASEYDAREAEFDSVTAAISRLEKYDGIRPTLAVGKTLASEARSIREDPEPEPGDGDGDASKGRSKRPNPFEQFETREYEDAFESFLRLEANAEERAALSVAPNAEGGYTVAQEWYRQLIESEREFGMMLQLATTIRTADSGQVHIPRVANPATGIADIVAEEGPYVETEDTFTEAVLDSYKIGTLIKISDELLHDSIFDLSAFITRRAGQAIGIKANNFFVVGTGTAQPQGIVPAATVGKTTAGAATVTASELVDLFHSLLRPYRSRATWMIKDSTAAIIRKLADSTGQFLWQPGLQAGQPDVLLGRPVYTDPDMPAMTTGLRSVLFGDIATAYYIREVGTATVKVLNELFAVNGQVGYRVDRRLDGELVDAIAVKVLLQA
jgi:HK97 family phage major capsid protein